MAKENPQGTGVQYKVLLKPTDIGLLVMRRMERPHLDKSAELRRFIELGYAAERAGFILDGTVLRHAGRTWDAQPDLTVEAQVLASPAGSAPAPRKPRATSQPADVDQPATASHVSDLPPGRDYTDTATVGTSPLRRNLRGMSR